MFVDKAFTALPSELSSLLILQRNVERVHQIYHRNKIFFKKDEIQKAEPVKATRFIKVTRKSSAIIQQSSLWRPQRAM
jgi:hypothetical protein